jgi:transposase
MRGGSEEQAAFCLMINLEEKVPQDHPLRAIKRRCHAIFREMSPDFRAAYSRTGRPGVPPERLLKALLLQALYSIRSEIQLMQAIDYNLLYRWFLDLGDAPVWTPEVFSMNRKRFDQHDLVRKFFDRVVAEALVEKFASPDHFTVDGTLIRSWASLKSLQARAGADSRPPDDAPGNPDVNFHGEQRGNATHVSATDPEALLARKGKGKEAHLCHSGHVLMENRNGLCLDIAVDAADGRAERRNARRMFKRVCRRHRLLPATLGADKGYDDGKFLEAVENSDGVIPHVPIKAGALVARDEAGNARRRARLRMRNKGYAISQRIRKRVEEIIGWLKTVGGLARARLVGRWKIAQTALATAAAYNLLRIVRLERAG